MATSAFIPVCVLLLLTIAAHVALSQNFPSTMSPFPFFPPFQMGSNPFMFGGSDSDHDSDSEDLFRNQQMFALLSMMMNQQGQGGMSLLPFLLRFMSHND